MKNCTYCNVEKSSDEFQTSFKCKECFRYQKNQYQKEYAFKKGIIQKPNHKVYKKRNIRIIALKELDNLDLTTEEKDNFKNIVEKILYKNLE